jgi:hypothetical protein
LLEIKFNFRNNITAHEFGTLVNIERLIRGMILDIFAVIDDGYVQNGNNYGFYANPGSSSSILSVFLPFPGVFCDFEHLVNTLHGT